MDNIIKINEEAKNCQTKEVKSSSIQMIKIGSGNSNSNIKSNVFNYNKVLDILSSIQTLSDSDEFATDFSSNTDAVKSVITDTIEMVKRKDTPTNINISLEKIKVFAEGIGKSTIATDINRLILKAIN